ncbi:hypothetical protein ACQJ1N_26490, partial [Klebsiella pneumoniae]|nr:hypothetical protein B0W99_29460 [Klebsiella pneumoniae subsp. pneumoniae]PNM35638.1 hypothetical protein AL478_023815 [Klebsiella pneumoniae]SXN73172.1 Uncharacterised protein [Klebsiella pneumoniae]
MMSLWDALRMNMMISYQELVRTFLSKGHALQRIRNLFFSCDAGARKQHSMSFFLIIPGNLVLPSCPLS